MRKKRLTKVKLLTVVADGSNIVPQLPALEDVVVCLAIEALIGSLRQLRQVCELAAVCLQLAVRGKQDVQLKIGPKTQRLCDRSSIL